ncbi:MAG: hypothetical protein DRJ09_05025 [Bacteroidetes bacterium]|nr:MAG: hypothetical protein DRJ09_05025 [Bacteroidota bacterium]
MKKLKLIILFMLLFTFPFTIIASDPPDPGGSPGTAPPLGGGAPVGSGMLILLGLGTIYGGRKLFQVKE